MGVYVNTYAYTHHTNEYAFMCHIHIHKRIDSMHSVKDLDLEMIKYAHVYFLCTCMYMHMHGATDGHDKKQK